MNRISLDDYDGFSHTLVQLVHMLTSTDLLLLESSSCVGNNILYILALCGFKKCILLY